MSMDYMSGTTISEYDLTLAIPGNVASVRARILEAIPQLGYKVLGEQPIHAKRAMKSCMSLNVLDYPTTITISLKQTNDMSVLATFNYEVTSAMSITKGDRQTLAREAEALAALTTERHTLSACRSCGTQITDESHFCRRCGAPLVVDVPELEVLRLTSRARSSYYNLVIGIFALLLAIVGLSVLFSFTGVWNSPFFWIGFALAVFGLFALIQGTWQLHFALNPKKTEKTTTATAHPAFKGSVTTALPPAPGRMSVIEGTTELLREKEPVHRKQHDTSELDTDQLM